jgi:hypothetical protein
MKVGSILLFIGIVALPTYFVLFYGTFRGAGEDAERYLETFGDSKRRNLVTMVLVITAFVVPNPVVAVAIMTIAIAWTFKESFLQHKKMRELSFNTDFERRLMWVSFVSPIAILCLFGSKLWFQAHAA